MERFIKPAADSIGALREADVYRVLVESGPAEYRQAIAAYIREKRPDLRAEVDDVMAEQARGETRTAPAPAAEPQAAAPVAAGPFANNYTALNGKTLTMTVQTEAGEAKMRMDAGDALRAQQERLDKLQALKNCMG